MRIRQLAPILTIGFLFTFTACVVEEPFNLDEISSIGIVVRNHWTEDNINDGKIVYIDLANARQQAGFSLVLK